MASVSEYSQSTGVGLFGLDSTPSMEDDDDQSPLAAFSRLTAKPYAFAGAVLSPKHARELTPSMALAVATALSDQSRKTSVPYTLWITEAWRVLGWAEPSAALFWEMATMYHTLFLAARAFAADYLENGANNIPPILSCGSASSVGSGTNNSLTDSRTGAIDKRKLSNAASAKELPVWLVSTFLLLHCEDLAYQRNLAAEDELRFYGTLNTSAAVELNPKMGFATLLHHSAALSPRTRIHAVWTNDNSNCCAFLLRHLRKVLLLAAVPHNPDAVRASMHLAAIPALPPPAARRSMAVHRYSVDELRRQHDEEHGNVGLGVHLTLDDLERLHLVFQPPSGGGIDDPPMKLGDFLWHSIYRSAPHPAASIPIVDVEHELRRHLEMELSMAGSDHDGKDDVSTSDEESTSKALARLSLGDKKADLGERAKQPSNQYHKELSYMHLRGTTILLKPSPAEASSGASMASGEHNILTTVGRLHDVTISDCSDAHFYLLQPFEHATIAACIGCTIVVGAVAGLLHVVDCERTNITCAARRVMASNSADTKLFVFSPSPPLLVGDHRSCQFAPYNTYYDGLREDLLATGLAAAVLPENQSSSFGHGAKSPESDGAWPPLQCASNKWKQPVELSKLEVPQVPGSPASSPSPVSSPTASPPGADDKAMSKSAGGSDAAMPAPVLLPAAEFNIHFVPLESEGTKHRRVEAEEVDENNPAPLESQYSRLLADMLQMSPFRLPVEYERRVLMKAERMKNIQQAVQKHLTEEQQKRFEEELNRGFREWLVTSGNLRQVLDLVHLERRGGV